MSKVISPETIAAIAARRAPKLKLRSERTELMRQVDAINAKMRAEPKVRELAKEFRVSVAAVCRSIHTEA